MENDPVTTTPAPTTAPVQQPTITTTRGTATNENLMLIFGILAIISLLFNIGPMLKITAGIFLIVAVISIVRTFEQPRASGAASPTAAEPSVMLQPPAQTGAFTAQPVTTASAPKQRSVLKTVGMVIALLLILPVMAYGVMIIFFIIALSTGGVRMGT